jgi:O-antigen ligase
MLDTEFKEAAQAGTSRHRRFETQARRPWLSRWLSSFTSELGPGDQPRRVRPFSDAAEVTGVSATSNLGILGLLVAALIWATATVWVRSSWIPGLSALAIWSALALAGCTLYSRTTRSRLPPAYWPLLALPLWGIVQISLGWTVSQSATIAGTLHWGTLAAIFVCTYSAAATRATVERLLDVFVAFASALAVLCILQLDTSAGKVLWLFDTGYTDQVFATFPYHNNYAQFIELALPVCLWRGLSGGRQHWAYLLIAGVMLASVVASGSRAGLALVCLETAVLVTSWVLRERRGRTPAIVLFSLLLVAAITVSGSKKLTQRMAQDDVWSLRPQLAAATWHMALKKPLTGWGLGSFPEVYPSVALIDTGKFINHAHNDWLESLAEGGAPFAVLLCVPFVLAAPMLWRRRWAIGVLAVCLHAFVDYPFPRLAVAGWAFFLFALAAAEHRISKGHRST